MKITIFENACFSIETEVTKTLIDPYLSKRKLRQEQGDFVLVSHGHFDHAKHLSSVTVPIYGNRYVAKFKQTDVNIEKMETWEMGNIEVRKIDTYKHPRWYQNNVVYDFLLFLFSGILRCGENSGFVFRSNGRTIYYTSDTLFSRENFENVEKNFKPNLILYCAQPSYLLPKLLMTKREAKELKSIFSGKLIRVHGHRKEELILDI